MAKKSETTTANKKKASGSTSTKSSAKTTSSKAKTADTKKSASGSKKSSASKSNSGQKNSTKAASNGKNTRSKVQKPEKKPIRREAFGVLCIVFAILSFLGYFNVDGLFYDLMSVVKGLIGYGYWIVPPCMLWSGIVLMTHRGRPVALRVTAILMLPILWGVIGHVLLFGVPLDIRDGIVEVWSVLYKSGETMYSGGAVAGLLAMGAEGLASVYGAVLLVVFLMILCLFVGANMTPAELIARIRERQPYAPEDYDDYSEPAPVKPVRKAERPAKKQAAQNTGGSFIMLDAPEDFSGMIDIPLDGEVRTRETKRTKAAPVESVEYEVVVDNDSFFKYKKKPVVKQTETPAPEQIEGKGIPELVAVETAESFADMGLVSNAKPAAPKKPTIQLAEGPVTIDDDDDVIIPPVVPSVVKEQPAAPKRGPQPSAAGLASALQSDGIFDEPKKLSKKEAAMGFHEFAAEVAKNEEEESVDYVFPPLNLLRSGGRNQSDSNGELNDNRRRLEATLDSFGVDATYVECTRGPTVTRYDFKLHTGVKLTKLTNLSDDIALALGVSSVRIAPIPDKISTVGIEVPNKVINTVYLRDIIGSDNFKNAPSKVSFAIGEDIGGNSIVSNIAKLPHMLIAGTTGSGKSVCINCLLLSLLYKATPDEVKLIMIDPKMVELGVYNGIPHLYVPVVTDPKKAAGALQWSVVEMMKRYKLFSEAGVRDLAGYNALCRRNGEKTMPQVVIVIDELADLMMVASKEVEESICRVAQMGRASGMHLVIATQRPSADVITGLMKANIPSRIAFAVSSALESRIILDQQGAEKLIGMGDMLYAPIGVGKPVRIQGAFVSDEERESVIEFIKNHCEVEYDQSVQAQIEKAAEEKNTSKGDGAGAKEEMHSEYDELLPQAVDVVLEAKQASVSMLQRRLKLGYSRAARIVDQMEEIGVVGPFEGSKPRQLLVTKEQWMEMQSLQGTAPMEVLSDLPEVSDEELFGVHSN